MHTRSQTRLLNENRQTRLSNQKTERPIENDESFYFTRSRKRAPASEPIFPTAKKIRVAPQSVPEEERVQSLSRQDILRILSKEMPLEKASIIEQFLNNTNIKNQQVPSIYSSYFFRKDIIKEFQTNLINKIPTDKLSGFPLSTYNLYNKDDILNNTFFREDRLGNRYTEKTAGYTDESQKNMTKFINLLSKNICSSIGGQYARNAVQKAIDLTKNEDKFDILVASTRVLDDLTLTLEQRMSGIVAFIIVELGECKKYPASYSINLICTDLKKAIPGTGSILMGAFLYTILSHPSNRNPSNKLAFPNGESFLKVTSKRLSNGTLIENATFSTNEPLVPIQHIAVLELANAYTNPTGLCMYEKYGFAYDPTMFSNDRILCFDDRYNLPMIINFDTKPGYMELSINDKKDKILNISAGLDRGFPKSKICSLRDQRQILLGYLKSIKLYIDNQPGGSLGDFEEAPDKNVLIQQLKTIHSSISRSTRTNSTREGTLDEFINYLENPPARPDSIMESKINKLITFLPSENIKGGKTKQISKTRKIKRNFSRHSRKNR